MKLISDAIARRHFAMTGHRSPWGDGDSSKPEAGEPDSGGRDATAGGAGSFADEADGSPVSDVPSPPPASPGPRNPWQPKAETPPRRSASIEDIFRSRGKGGGSGGGGGGGGIPRLPVPADLQAWLPQIIGGILVVALLASTTHQLGSTQQGVVTTFGKYSRTIDSGVSFTLPWPIQEVDITDVTSIRRDSIPEGDGEKLMVTGDQNLVDLSYLVRWNVKNLKLYDLQLKDPDATVREVAEAAMRASVAEVKLNDVMGGAGRADIEQAVRQRMQTVLDAYRSGVLIQGVDIKKADPPAKVVGAFQQVTVARQEAQKDMSNAQAFAQQVIARAQGDAAAFDKVYAQYKLAPEVTRRRMYYETMEKVLAGNDKVITEGNTTSYLPLPEVRRKAERAADNAASGNTTVTGGQ